MEFAFKQTK